MIVFVTSYDKTEFIKVSPDDSLNIIIQKYHLSYPNQLYFNDKELIDYGESEDSEDEDKCNKDHIFKKNKYHKYHKYKMFHKYRQAECNSTFADLNIKNYDILEIEYNAIGGGIDNIKDEIDLKIGFDMNLIKRDELYVNLIHFDLKMTNSENYDYYNKFKVNVVGGFYAIDDLNILKDYLEKIKERDIPFIVISSGSSGKDVISICKHY
jgi:hypothetical protein